MAQLCTVTETISEVIIAFLWGVEVTGWWTQPQGPSLMTQGVMTVCWACRCGSRKEMVSIPTSACEAVYKGISYKRVCVCLGIMFGKMVHLGRQSHLRRKKSDMGWACWEQLQSETYPSLYLLLTSFNAPVLMMVLGICSKQHWGLLCMSTETVIQKPVDSSACCADTGEKQRCPVWLQSKFHVCSDEFEGFNWAAQFSISTTWSNGNFWSVMSFPLLGFDVFNGDDNLFSLKIFVLYCLRWDSFLSLNEGRQFLGKAITCMRFTQQKN